MAKTPAAACPKPKKRLTANCPTATTPNAACPRNNDAQSSLSDGDDTDGLPTDGDETLRGRDSARLRRAPLRDVSERQAADVRVRSVIGIKLSRRVEKTFPSPGPGLGDLVIDFRVEQVFHARRLGSHVPLRWPRILAGRSSSVRNKANTAWTTRPKSRNGIESNQMIGRSTKTSNAKGQQSTNRMHQAMRRIRAFMNHRRFLLALFALSTTMVETT